jgi:hypothetical protein
MFRRTLQIGLIWILAFSVYSTGFAGDPAGKIIYLKGDAWVKSGFAKKRLKSGSIVYSGDQIRTGDGSRVHMRFLDKTFFALGAEAKMNVDVFSESENADESFGASILKGAFRFVSGLFAKKKPKSVSIRVSVGTIGIRGTHVAGEVFEREETDTGVIETSAQIMLLENEDGGDSAIEVSNQYGSVVIDEPGYGTLIPDEHSPPGAVRRMQIRTINNLLRAIRNTTRSSTQKRKLP